MPQAVPIPKGQTNATRMVVVGRDPKTREPIVEEAQVNETIPGGYYLNADGSPKDSNGNLLDGSDETPSIGALLAEMSPDNPMYARVRAAAMADVRAAAREHVPTSHAPQTSRVVQLPDRPAMRPEDEGDDTESGESSPVTDPAVTAARSARRGR